VRLTLIRHGQSPSNLQTLLDTDAPGPPLTELGLDQAAAIARTVEPTVDLLMSSPLTRARQTADAVAAAHGLDVVERLGLREVMAGELEMRNDPDSLVLYRSCFLRWTRGDLDVRIPGGEDGNEVMARFGAVVAEAAATHCRHAVLVTHGAVIRSWVGFSATNIHGFHSDPRLGNTGVVTLLQDDRGGWELEEWERRTPADLADYQVPMDPDVLADLLSRADHPHPNHAAQQAES
jgi:probable phosphoglycerate mutase